MAHMWDDGENRYRTSDGQVFNTEYDAENHQRNLDRDARPPTAEAQARAKAQEMHNAAGKLKHDSFERRFSNKDYQGQHYKVLWQYQNRCF